MNQSEKAKFHPIPAYLIISGGKCLFPANENQLLFLGLALKWASFSSVISSSLLACAKVTAKLGMTPNIILNLEASSNSVISRISIAALSALEANPTSNVKPTALTATLFEEPANLAVIDALIATVSFSTFNQASNNSQRSAPFINSDPQGCLGPSFLCTKVIDVIRPHYFTNAADSSFIMMRGTLLATMAVILLLSFIEL